MNAHNHEDRNEAVYLDACELAGMRALFDAFPPDEFLRYERDPTLRSDAYEVQWTTADGTRVHAELAHMADDRHCCRVVVWTPTGHHDDSDDGYEVGVEARARTMEQCATRVIAAWGGKVW